MLQRLFSYNFQLFFIAPDSKVLTPSLLVLQCNPADQFKACKSNNVLENLNQVMHPFFIQDFCFKQFACGRICIPLDISILFQLFSPTSQLL